MIFRLRPGETAVRRDDHHLQIGIDAPSAVVVPDTADVRRAAYELEHGRGVTQTDMASPAVASLVMKLERAGLLRDHPAPLAARLLGPAELVSEFRALAPVQDSTPMLSVVMSAGPLRRDRVDDLIRDGQPHLVLSGGPDGWTVGPYVLPGVTACLRCSDADKALGDPRRGLVVDQYASRTQGDEDPVTRSLAVAYAVREVRMIVRGERPTTWSSTVRIAASGTLEPQRVRRHPACGCAWDIALTT